MSTDLTPEEKRLFDTVRAEVLLAVGEKLDTRLKTAIAALRGAKTKDESQALTQTLLRQIESSASGLIEI